jgi:photosystem II stability/assembly factor-like uncharacterized protein
MPFKIWGGFPILLYGLDVSSALNYISQACFFILLNILEKGVKIMSVSTYQKPSRRSLIVLIVFFVFVSGMALNAAKVVQSTKPELRLKWYQEHVAMKDQSLFNNVKWQFLGPINVSGRMTDVEVVTPKGKNYTIYVAGASGGVLKTVNEGTTWEPIFQNAISTSIGDITLAPSNSDIIWVGTGEANIFRSSQAGAGVFKSMDAGKTWTHMGLTDTNTIPRIVIHPKNPDIVYVAASGHEWTNNKERGVYKTTDGGKKWQKILFISDQTGAIDLMMDPSDPDTLYASTWQRIRNKWNDPRNEDHFSESGIHKTTDGGKTWKPINKGLPIPKYRGRIGIDLCRSNPNVLYAFVDNYEVVGDFESGEMDSYGRPKMGKIKGATIFRSDDKGMNWRQVSQNNKYMENLSATYGWVFAQMRVDPSNENRIYVMGLGLNVSDDGGKTFRHLPGMHGDHHGLWIDPDNSDYLINVNDGGVVFSYDAGKNWRQFTDTLPLVQFFNIMYDMAKPFNVYGSVQDHGSYRAVVDLSKGRQDIPAVKWDRAPGGEGSSHAIDPTDSNTVYAAGFYGSIYRSDPNDENSKSLVPKPKKGAAPYRGQWLAPFIISPHNPRILYHGMNYLFRSMDRGDSWQKISPDLTYNDPKKIGDIQYQTIFCISESPLSFGLIYAGTDDGRLHVTKDSGGTWKEITKGLAKGKWFSRVVASAYDKATVFATQNGKREDDFTPYIWKSTDFGKTWKSIASNIPIGPVNVIREDPKSKNILYVGTDFGVYVTLDGGNKWYVLAKDLPTTYIQDLVIHPRDSIMVAASHGRGVFALDVSHLQELTPEVLNKKATFFKTCSAKLPKRSWWGWWGGQNAYFHYYLKDAVDAKLVIKDAEGNVVNQLKSKADAGLNVFKWELKFKADKKKKTKEGRKNPFVKAGNYSVELIVGAETLKGAIKINK